jgi:hypothetical protein
VLRDPEVQRAKSLEYRKKVEAADPPRVPDLPADGIAKRLASEQQEKARQRKPERSWLPSNETAQFTASIGALASVVADVVNFMPAKVDAIAASALAAVVTGVAWGNKRWKDKHGDRSEG